MKVTKFDLKNVKLNFYPGNKSYFDYSWFKMLPYYWVI
jgi:hypothetical protein